MAYKSYSPNLYSRKVNSTTVLLVLNGKVVSTFSSQEDCDNFVVEFMLGC